MKRKILLIIVALAVLYGGFWLYGRYYKTSSVTPVAMEFIGRIQKIENGVLYVNGNYAVGEVPIHGLSPVDVQITVAKDAKFIKELVYLPTAAELEKTGGVYKSQDLKREKTSGTIDDLTKLQDGNTGIIFTAVKNIYGKTNFEVSQLDYIEPVYPQ